MSLPAVQHETKSGTSAERVVWMTRTSDVFGSHLKTDIESYLTLIRRKIQEKCATTMELITMIRRFKIGDSGHVTPNEFRFTLIKFGIILSQPLVDRIFNVFDSDRSGTMDFDEFAMWIMNSEFRPAVKHGKEVKDSPRTLLRKKFYECVKANEIVFRNMKKQISFLEFVSDITRKNMDMTEKETRSVFQILDPKDTGFIDSAALLKWAETGQIEQGGRKKSIDAPSNIRAKSLEELVAKVVGRNNRQLEASFAHIKHGEGIKINFDEFRRCLLNAGVGKNVHDSRQLFNALSQSSGGTLADIDLFFASLSPMVADPATEVSIKPMPTSTVCSSRADRHLRESLRKSFKDVRAEIEAADPTASGFIDAEALYKILVKRCMPLTFQDFRFILQQIKKEPGTTTRVNYHHFLHGYNPVIAPHPMAGSATLKAFGNPPSPTNSHNGSHAGTAHSHNSHRTSGMVTASSTHYSSPTTAPEFTLDPPSELLKKGNSFKKATDDLQLFRSSSKLSSSASTGNFRNQDHPETHDLKRVWHTMLKECHKADPQRTGSVSRNAFIQALERGNTNRMLTPESMNRLADTYSLTNGLVNYIGMFRNYLNDITAGSQLAGIEKARSLASLHNSIASPEKPLVRSLELKPIHPWDFDYKREKHPEPYWRTAASMAKDMELQAQIAEKAATLNHVPPPNEKGAQDLNPTEREAILSQYDERMLNICAKCYRDFAPIWRPFRNQLKKTQIISQRGSILTTNFLMIMEENGIKLSKVELGAIVRIFRGAGMQDVVKYDDFLRVCLLVKDRPIV